MFTRGAFRNIRRYASSNVQPTATLNVAENPKPRLQANFKLKTFQHPKPKTRHQWGFEICVVWNLLLGISAEVGLGFGSLPGACDLEVGISNEGGLGFGTWDLGFPEEELESLIDILSTVAAVHGCR